MSRTSRKKRKQNKRGRILPGVFLLLALILALGGVLFFRLGAPALPWLPAAPAAVEETAEPTAAVEETVEPPRAVETPAPARQSVPEDFSTALRISEVMPSNKSTLADGGLFPDWVELYNSGPEPLPLGGIWLCCDGGRWPLPDETLAPGAYLLIFCDGSGRDARHASFTVEKDGASLTLESASGAVGDRFDTPAASGDESFRRGEDGQAVLCDYATPGFDNSREGYCRFQESLGRGGPLQIYEVMVYNEWVLRQNGAYYDWVEIKNVSDAPVETGGYYLSDSGSDRKRFALPSRTLQPGELLVIYCTGDETVTGERFASFGLSALNDQLYLSAADGTLCDYACVRGVPYHGSFGRLDGQNGFFYFASPTPGENNAGGARTVAARPELLGRDGVFDGVESVSVTLSGDGEIRYTTDGSAPTASSALYTGPLTLTQTGVVRAVRFREGELPSPSLDLSFIINEGHSLPVVSLVADPSDIFGGKGLYSNPSQEIERPGSVSLFETDGTGFNLECGIKLHGATSKMAQSKKSFKLCFRSRYEGDLHYDLFENGVTDFSSILLRAAQESTYSTYMRDNLMHQLAQQAFPELPVQDYKYSVLYINGRYWGVYNIREAHSAAHYARHYGYDEDTVTQWKEAWPGDSPIGEIYRFALNHSLKSDTYYEQVAARINVDSVIGWTVMQAYSGNVDFYPPNTRFYYSTQDGQMRYALVDLDLAMFAYDMFDPPLHFGYAYNTLANRLLQNRQYQLRMAELLSEALRGPMSDESVLALIDKLAAELRPEIERDRQRWARGNARLDSLEGWETKWDDGSLPWLRDFVTRKGGRAYLIMNSFVNHSNLTKEEIEQYFGDIVYQKHEAAS